MTGQRYTSQTGDPHLHTVLTVFARAPEHGRRWNGIDGRALVRWAGTVGSYAECVFAALIEREWPGLLSARRVGATQSALCAPWVPGELIEKFSTRRRDIVASSDDTARRRFAPSHTWENSYPNLSVMRADTSARVQLPDDTYRANVKRASLDTALAMATEMIRSLATKRHVGHHTAVRIALSALMHATPHVDNLDDLISVVLADFAATPDIAAALLPQHAGAARSLSAVAP